MWTLRSYLREQCLPHTLHPNERSPASAAPRHEREPGSAQHHTARQMLMSSPRVPSTGQGTHRRWGSPAQWGRPNGASQVRCGSLNGWDHGWQQTRDGGAAHRDGTVRHCDAFRDHGCPAATRARRAPAALGAHSAAGVHAEAREGGCRPGSARGVKLAVSGKGTGSTQDSRSHNHSPRPPASTMPPHARRPRAHEHAALVHRTRAVGVGPTRQRRTRAHAWATAALQQGQKRRIAGQGTMGSLGVP